MTEKEKIAAVSEEEEQKLNDQELSESELENVSGGGPSNRHR